ncbi:hypothetical protein X777_04735 [Ooceraea biroi]|uniref:Uncharacterized protein n=1 Tax=Ooceraea biroi TaxID=2015173 RepID=A0A026X3F0_OOCBI|nr:hypothetical protein X777_04735 [Ooceraea biroi]
MEFRTRSTAGRSNPRDPQIRAKKLVCACDIRTVAAELTIETRNEYMRGTTETIILPYSNARAEMGPIHYSGTPNGSVCLMVVGCPAPKSQTEEIDPENA